jgi:acyl dehydratase
MRCFEDIEVGEYLTSSELVVDGEDMINFAKNYDPQWFHVDVKGASSTRFGEVIASGIYVAALWRKLDHELNGDVDYICGVCWEKAEWKLAVRAGDTLRATSEVVEKRRSSSDQTRGVITYICRLEKPCDTTVFEFRSIALINCRRDN